MNAVSSAFAKSYPVALMSSAAGWPRGSATVTRSAAGEKRHRHTVAPRTPKPGQRAAAGRDAKHAAARQTAQLRGLEVARAVEVGADSVVHLEARARRGHLPELLGLGLVRDVGRLATLDAWGAPPTDVQ